MNLQVVVLDEAVSALDVTVQAQILRPLDDLQRDLGLTYLFVPPDLRWCAIADTVTVLHNRSPVETGAAAQVFAQPTSEHPRALIDAIPGAKRTPALQGG